MPEQAEIMEWRGCEVVDQDGDKVGKLDEIYLDRETGQPEWAIVNTGLFGRKSSFVPLKDALREGEMIRVPYQKEHINDAPSVDPDGEISPDEEQQVYTHYGLDYSRAESGSGLPEGGGTAGDTPASGGGSAEDAAAAGGGASGTAATGGSGTAGGTTSDTATGGGGSASETAEGRGSTPGTASTGESRSDAESGTGSSAGDTASTAGESRSGLRLQRMFQEDVRLGSDDEVVERRVVQEERVRPDEEDGETR